MDSLIESSCRIANELREASQGIKLPPDDKYLIPALMFSMAVEHHVSIVSLIQSGCTGSAASLLRCLFESYVKGVWFRECAGQRDFERIRSDKFSLRFDRLVTDIEGARGKGISIPKERYWNSLNSLTHTGVLQLGRRFDGRGISSSYTEEFVEDILRFSNNYALLCYRELGEMSSDQALLRRVFSVAVGLGLIDGN